MEMFALQPVCRRLSVNSALETTDCTALAKSASPPADSSVAEGNHEECSMPCRLIDVVPLSLSAALVAATAHRPTGTHVGSKHPSLHSTKSLHSARTSAIDELTGIRSVCRALLILASSSLDATKGEKILSASENTVVIRETAEVRSDEASDEVTPILTKYGTVRAMPVTSSIERLAPPAACLLEGVGVFMYSINALDALEAESILCGYQSIEINMCSVEKPLIIKGESYDALINASTLLCRLSVRYSRSLHF
jgi:hypothetical protein